MMGAVVFQIQQVGMAFPSQSHHYRNRSRNKISVSFPKWQYQEIAKQKLIPPSASVSSPGATPEYPDNLLDTKSKRKSKSIAGVDQEELSDPNLLADPDSCFCEFKRVHIHHKVCNPEPQSHSLAQLPHTTSQKLGLPMILLHGFGASVFSWSRVMKPLAEVAASKVLAFDRPAFGLTSRVDCVLHSSSATDDTKPLNIYSMAFSVLLVLYFIDFLASDKAILVGHSAGSYIAVKSYFEAPERIAALILVAPAIFAPRSIHKVAERNKLGSDIQTGRDGPNSNMLGKQFSKILEVLSKFTMYIGGAIMQMVKGMTAMVNSLCKKALSAILRSAFGVTLIRMVIDKFGIAAVRNAWYDSNRVTEHVLNGYTKPLRVKGWDKALAEFTAATLASADSDSKPPLSKRLHEISCPVLIVTGDNDRLVPTWNAKRLSKAMPGSHLEVIKHCGHLPQEEKAEEFVSIVDKFLQRAFGDSKEMSLQTVV